MEKIKSLLSQERGLKLFMPLKVKLIKNVAPLTGAWIEMTRGRCVGVSPQVVSLVGKDKRPFTGVFSVSGFFIVHMDAYGDRAGWKCKKRLFAKGCLPQ